MKKYLILVSLAFTTQAAWADHEDDWDHHEFGGYHERGCLRFGERLNAARADLQNFDSQHPNSDQGEYTRLIGERDSRNAELQVLQEKEKPFQRRLKENTGTYNARIEENKKDEKLAATLRKEAQEARQRALQTSDPKQKRKEENLAEDDEKKARQADDRVGDRNAKNAKLQPSIDADTKGLADLNDEEAKIENKKPSLDQINHRIDELTKALEAFIRMRAPYVRAVQYAEGALWNCTDRNCKEISYQTLLSAVSNIKSLGCDSTPLLASANACEQKGVQDARVIYGCP